MSLEFKSAQSGLPSDWEIKSIIELGNNKKNCVQTGPFGAQLHSSDYKNEGIPLLLIRNITDEGLDINDLPKISPDDAERLKRYSLQINDIVFSRVGRVGSCFLVTPSEEGWIISGQLLRIRLEEDNVDYKYLYYYLKSKKVQEYLKGTSVGSTRESINTTILEQLKVALPPIDEQQKIAEILSTVDEKIEIIEEQIAQTTELKKGLMQQLLTQGIGHTQFKDSPLGEIPESWEVREMHEITTYVDYRGKTPPKVDSGTFLVTAKNIRDGRIDYEISKEYVPNDKYLEVMSRGLPNIGDVLITTEAPLGQVAAIDDPSIALAQRIIKYRGIDEMLSNLYLKYALMSQYFQDGLEKESTGSTVKGIKGSRLHKQKVLLPTIKEQNQISEILKTIDDKLIIQTGKKRHYQDLKRGLMQQLLTGKLRVNHLIESEVLA